jgi:signal transduction histidine kinase
MTEKTKNKNSQAEIFKKEWETLEHTQEIQKNQDISKEKLQKEYKHISQKFKKLLKEMMKITRIGDANYRKLMSAQDRIREQNNQLEILNKELRAANAVKDRLYSIIAHDLRDPFQVLLITTEVLNNDYLDMEEEETKKYIGGIFKTTVNLAALLENLLQWTRSQHGEIECKPRKIDLHSLAAEYIEYFGGNAQNKKITLLCKIPGNCFAYADENMIKCVLRNLISNGVKFTNPGGKVTLTVEEKDDFIVTSVSDTGVGIPEEKLCTLFKLGESVDKVETYSTPGTAKEKGTGLGLMLCKEFVEKNDGTIRVTSQVGKGSTFEFSLPKS